MSCKLFRQQASAVRKAYLLSCSFVRCDCKSVVRTYSLKYGLGYSADTFFLFSSFFFLLLSVTLLPPHHNIKQQTTGAARARGCAQADWRRDARAGQPDVPQVPPRRRRSGGAFRHRPVQCEWAVGATAADIHGHASGVFHDPSPGRGHGLPAKHPCPLGRSAHAGATARPTLGSEGEGRSAGDCFRKVNAHMRGTRKAIARISVFISRSGQMITLLPSRLRLRTCSI